MTVENTEVTVFQLMRSLTVNDRGIEQGHPQDVIRAYRCNARRQRSIRTIDDD